MEEEQGMLATRNVVVTPGSYITQEAGNLRGHGTYVHEGALYANVAGMVQRVNRLISVQPISSRYVGEVGDVVVGRIVEVGAKRWTVDINARQHAILMLSSINLSGGVQRRRTTEDQLQMRSILSENDLISADVHSYYGDGAIALHARSLKYGKLENGVFLKVPPALIKRLKQHFVTLPCGVDAILGNNGYIWLTETFDLSKETSLTDEEKSELNKNVEAGIAQAIEKKRELMAQRTISPESRLRIARVANAIEALRASSAFVTPVTITEVYNLSVQQKLEPKNLLHPPAAAKLVHEALSRLDASNK